MALFRKRKKDVPELDRKQAFQAVPVMNQLVSVEYNAVGNVVLNLPRKRTGMVRLVARVFKLTPYKQIELDELGTRVVELCDGTNSVADITAQFSERFQLSRRETQVSMLSYLKSLAQRGIIGFAVPPREQQ